MNACTMQDFDSNQFPTWCPGCGDFGIWGALKQALAELNLSPHQILLVYGIGCSGNMASFLNVYGFHSLHGRTIPTAIGAKIANPEIPVICIAGDGDCYGEGGNHFLHGMRGNWDVTVIVHDNRVYSLTTGQTSPTSRKGHTFKTAPQGAIETPMNPIAHAITGGATFIAQASAANVLHTKKIFTEAIKHKGFSLVNVLQPCITYDKIHTHQFYNERCYNLQDDKTYTMTKGEAKKRSEESGNRIPTGIFYKEERPTYLDELTHVKNGPLAKQSLENIDVGPLMKEFL